MPKPKELKIKLFADGADLAEMEKAYKSGAVKGFTTNPTLMKKAGITNYEEFAKAALKIITDLPISFEVFSDEFDDMERQARIISSWGDNVYVKIPITNTRGEPSYDLIKKLSAEKIKLNITAILTTKQVKAVAKVLSFDVPTIVSVFAGRVADTGKNPIPVMKKCLKLLKSLPNAELLWASPREVLNVYQADSIGCHIVTALPELLKKMPLNGKNLTEYSLETVRMFHNDALSSGFKI